MITTADLAGFFAAHAVWCISDGDTLIPLLAYIDEDGQRQLDRLVYEELREAVEEGRKRLTSNEMSATDAVLVYDGYLSIDDEKTDALILEIRDYGSAESEFVIGIPFTPHSTGEFRVHRPKILAWEDCDNFDLDQVMESFFLGVSTHEKGSEIWDAALDESR